MSLRHCPSTRVQGPRESRRSTRTSSDYSETDAGTLQLWRSLSVGSSSTSSSESSEDSQSFGSECSLQRRHHIKRRQRRLRPLPSPPSPPPPPPESRAPGRFIPPSPTAKIRRLPVPPLPISAFPAVSPTRCSSPIPSSPMSPPPLPDDVRRWSPIQIDWDAVMEEVLERL
ncbi:hypothetical protein PC9H_005315 [Pleurotus ostreatus]|uniref:Uncharacterized protein n=2 Tax=Pleurotus ostreatus TaxID=5322 RepID=A0A067NZI6_PLEO1|nr:uncharacterized protein PC9H_005315 [Pleurotus ostreatus]KAF7433365.1 hypothetical protein PC9H_005315 [Pleurotus ostreatus]KDQ29041.1 hypothetical protein PLEOSDRAFT_156774 [Pleurotus ostreatus PC15]